MTFFKASIFLSVALGHTLFGQNLNLYFGGDSFLFSDFVDRKYQEDPQLTNSLKNKDLFLVNLEGAFCKNKSDIKKCSSDKCFKVIHEESKTLRKLKELTVDYTSLGNNHILDCSKTGEEYTQELMRKNNISYSGTREKPYTIIQRKNKKIAVYSVGFNNFISSFNDKSKFTQIAKELSEKKARKEIDYIIAMIHMGTENKEVSSLVTGETEIFYGENRGNPKEIAKFLIDNGADVIVGHGPHVLRAIDIYKNKVIFYSLGNFYTDKGINTNGLNGLSVLANAEIDDHGNFVRGKLISLQQQTSHKPLIDLQMKSCKRVNELSRNMSSNVLFDGCSFKKK